MGLSGKSVAFHTLGCKLNFAESSTISRDLQAAGMHLVDLNEGADVVVINTCSVTNQADVECRAVVRKALRANDRLGGHIVSGHVDGMGVVSQFEQIGESWLLQVLAPPSLAKYLAYKGSITVNGVSLTVNRVEDGPEGCMVSINLIPHTIENTALGHLKDGSQVNLEIDTVARYVERMLSLDTSLKANP